MDIVIKLGKRLKMIRIASGVKQKDLADVLKVPAPLLSMYERGSREPTLAFLNQFAKNFNIPLSQLFTFIEENPTPKNKEIGSLMSEMKSLLLSIEKKTLKGK